MPFSCGKSFATITDGFMLNSPGLCMRISDTIYNRDFKTSHPQIKIVITTTQYIIDSILSHKDKTLPVGHLVGTKIQPLSGETIRFKCTDFILTPLIALRYQFATPQDKLKYDKERLSGHILGKFIGGVPFGGSNLEKDFISSLDEGKICLIVCGRDIGQQKGTLKVSSAATEEIGIFVE